MELKEYFKQRYQGSESFLQNVVFPIFGEDRFDDGYNEPLLEGNPELETIARATGVASIERVGTIAIPVNPIDIFDIRVASHVQLTRNRVGVQQLVRRIMSTYSSAFMLFHYDDDAVWDWRFSFCSKRENSDTTDSKRYTFLLGPGQSCRTAADNFQKLADKQGDIRPEDIRTAFDVEALSKEFFEKYKWHYERFVEYITGKRFVKEGGKWKEKTVHEPHAQMYAGFGSDDKRVRDYVKKLLGRIVFLHFLQKKGWLGVPVGKQWGEGDMQFMKTLFDHSTPEQRADYLDTVLEPLFAQGIDTEREDGLYDTGVSLPYGSTVRIPYLNGGLFERDALDEVPTQFPEEFFADLMDFFYQYNFTIDENDPNDAQVGVDPEMLGRIFENLLEDNKDKGAFYTPKEIVQYMCRQSLTAYLQTNIEGEADRNAIAEFVETYNVGALPANLVGTIDERLKDVKICDPAIGSGAFPMGLLKELFLCRGAIEDFSNATDIKRHIIQNNIYGVDIERGAVDIARLRFWLSLVVDEETPEALPNLDYKIMQGNSLLEQYQGVDLTAVADSKYTSSDSVSLFENMVDVYRRELRQKLFAYYSCDNHDQRKALRQEIAGNVKQQLTEQGCRIDFGDLDLAANTEFFLWHTWFYDVFAEGGFDIVIGNPPYISAPAQIANATLSNQRTLLAANKNYTTLYQKWDLYVAFLEAGIKHLCREQGVCSMIVPFPLTNQLYAKKLRTMMTADCNLFELVDLNGTKIFDNATVSNCIPFVQRTLSQGSTVISHIGDDRKISPAFVQPHDRLVQDPATRVWNVTQEQRQANRHTDMNVLGDYCYISKGMVLNADETKAKGEFKKDDLISETRDTLHPRPYIEAKDIEPYCVKRVRYLEYNTPRCPDQLSRPTFRELYEVDKLVMNCLGRINCTIDDKAHYLHNHSIYCAILWNDLHHVNNKSIAASVKRYSRLSRPEMEKLSAEVSLGYLLALLNSRYAQHLLALQRGNDYHIYPEHIRNLPIPAASSSMQAELSALAQTIISKKQSNPSSDTTSEELLIDLLVYRLYGLTYDEVLVIDPETPITREEYENHKTEETSCHD